jgi:HD-GYP domain-containing protein (c-di-GMP phosphodiesterase class II)
MDGSGYPDGLSGSDIPLAARIVFACDAFDAMTADRPYSVARTTGDAVAELRRCAGSQFDALVVETLCGVLAERGDGDIDVDLVPLSPRETAGPSPV